MFRTVTHIAAFVAIAWLQLPLLSQQQSPARENRAGLISELIGAASVKETAEAPVMAKRFAPLSAGAVVRMGRESRAVIVLAGGKRFALGAQARATVHPDRLVATAGPIEELSSLPPLPPLVALDATAPKALGGVRLRSSAISGLSPAKGSALASETTLRFNPVPNAGHYVVEIENEQGIVLFRLETITPRVSVPSATLPPGGKYHWTVRTTDLTGAQARGSADFRTLSTDEEKIRNALKRRLDNEGDASSIALMAAIDRQLGLLQEALDGFRAAAARSPDDAALREAVKQLEVARGGDD